MKIFQYKLIKTHLKHYCTKEVDNICSNCYGVYFMFPYPNNTGDLIKSVECLNYLCLTDGFYSLYELGEEELKKLEDNFWGFQ